jgi:hypothetical protein
MTQEELRTKLESYDIKKAEAYDLIYQNDDAREMAINYKHMEDALFACLKAKWQIKPSDEIRETIEKLLDLIFDEELMYKEHSACIERELAARLNKDNN